MVLQSYSAFGLIFKSNLLLPFLPQVNIETDLLVHYGGYVKPLADPPLYPQIGWKQEGTDWIWHYSLTNGIILKIHISDSAHQLSIYYSCPEVEDIFPILMGPGLGAALHLRGIPLLHGASVVLNDGAILISGLSEMGKSTLTAMLVAAGLPLLTEDLTPLKISTEEIEIFSGYPALQLHAEALRGLGFSLEGCPPVYSALIQEEDKRWLDINCLSGGFNPLPTPLRIIYILSGRRRDLKKPEIKPLRPVMASLALLEHLYGRRWLNVPPHKSLNLCARLAERVQVRRVWISEGLDTVADTAQAIIADANHA